MKMPTMITVSYEGGSERPASVKEFLVAILVLAATGVLIPSIFWGIWYLLAGYVPKFLGFSRFWIDAVSAPFYALIIFTYIGTVMRACDELSEDGTYLFSTREFIYTYPWLSLTGLFLAIDFVVSIFLSFAVGLAGIVVLAAIIGVGYGCLRWFLSYIFSLFAGIGGGQEIERTK